MKNRILLITVFILGILPSIFATNYYFSATGSDSNTGTNSTSPYQSIDKLNTLILLSVIKAGDSVLFKCGDTFRGQISMTITGTANSPFIFSSYGTGNKPIISGAQLVTGWSVLDSIRYIASFSQNAGNFFVNNKEQTLARYPNNGKYLTLDSAQLNYLKDLSITSLNNNLFAGSKICIHTAQWCWEKTGIASVSADKINYTSPLTIAAISQYSYFVYDNINHLDTATEWKYDNTSHTLTFIPSAAVHPNTLNCEASVDSNGIRILGAASYIIINNLSFEKQINAGILIGGAGNRYIQTSNCSFARQYSYGINDKGKYNEVYNCTFREVDGIALFVSGTGSNATIHHNTLRNIGQFRNSGIGGQINGTAIKAAFVDSCTIHHNDIDSTGYCGISADGGYHLIEKNIIKNAMLLNNDGAALKSFGAGSHHIIFRNNFITTSDGNTEGTYNANFITPAIYFDFNVNNSVIQDNTVYGRTQKGIFQNAGDVNNTISGNIIYGANFGLDMNGHTNQGTAAAMSGYNIKKNVFWLKNAADFMWRQIDFNKTYNYGAIDSNYYFQPYSTKFGLRPDSSTVNLSLSTWRAENHDVNAKSNSFYLGFKY